MCGSRLARVQSLQVVITPFIIIIYFHWILHIMVSVTPKVAIFTENRFCLLTLQLVKK